MRQFGKALLNLLLAVGVIVAVPLLDASDAGPARADMARAATAGLERDAGANLVSARQRGKQKKDRRHDRGRSHQQKRQQGRARDDHAHQKQQQKKKHRKKSKGTTAQGLCAEPGTVRMAGGDACTHGADPAPPGFDVQEPVPPLHTRVASAQAAILACDGDGQNGFRVQILYVRASDTPNRFAEFLPSIRAWAAEENEIVQLSAAETGGIRQIRFVQDPATCQPAVVEAVVSPDGLANFWTMIGELQGLGFQRTDRIYQAFVDATNYCGIGVVWNDDRHDGSVNRHNIGPSYSRIDSGCWGGAIAAHELLHNLGGVQLSAPHSSGGFHCIDEWDVMCYADSSHSRPLEYDCANPLSDALLLDCNHDDYFNTDPPPGSYLATHWNAANNRFLIGAASPSPAAPPPGAGGAEQSNPHKQKTSGKRGKAKHGKAKHGKGKSQNRSRNRSRISV
jgi:hypothetical protein